jgi:hypothetical protein
MGIVLDRLIARFLDTSVITIFVLFLVFVILRFRIVG